MGGSWRPGSVTGVGEVIVLAGGDAVGASAGHHLPAEATVIAADSGFEAAAVLGLTVDLVVGDLDSLAVEQLSVVRDRGIPVEQYPVDKDDTDLALAMDAAMRRSPARITVVGGHGGRLDHLLANAALLASSRYAAVSVEARMGAATVTVVHGSTQRVPRSLHGRPGETVSLVPMHGDARGVRTTGLRFALDGETLTAGSSRGISNEFTDQRARVHLEAGVLLVVQPGDAEPTKG